MVSLCLIFYLSSELLQYSKLFILNPSKPKKIPSIKMKKEHGTTLIYTKNRVSFFDISDENSEIQKNAMRGFYIMFILVTAYYIAISSIHRFFSVGYFVEDSFFWDMVEDGKFVALVWPGVFIYSWLAFVLQLMILAGLPKFLASFLQHLTQSVMFLTASCLVLVRDWGFSQTLFVLVLTFTHFMKMHSYTMINRDLRRCYLADPKNSEYPANITVKDYFIYLVTPALVYQTKYPTRPNFRLSYFLLKALLLLVEITSVYMLISEYMIPVVIKSNDLSFIEIYLKLIVPCVVAYMLMFLIIFEQILNLFAELSYFGDREFYQDWWNSNGFDDFSRKWNRPVHFFLYKHLYLECIQEYKISVQKAKTVTFIFSGLCHELIVTLICRKITPYLFGLMMFQLPLILLVKIVNTKDFGNYLFWTGIITGPALLFTLYCKF